MARADGRRASAPVSPDSADIAATAAAVDAQAAAGLLNLELFWSPRAGELRQQTMALPVGSSLAQALEACEWFDGQPLEALSVGIWGKTRPLDTPLRDGDRIEIYRPLTVDPKEARRQRFVASGKRIVTRHRPLGRKA